MVRTPNPATSDVESLLLISSWKFVVAFVIIVAFLIVTIQGNHIIGQAIETSYLPSTGTGQPKLEILPPCPVDTWPHIFDGNHVNPGAVQNSIDRAYALAVTSDGRYLYLGGVSSNVDLADPRFWVSKHDHCGNVVWATHFDDIMLPPNLNQRINDIVLDETRGQIYVVGSYFSESLPGGVRGTGYDIFVARLDASTGAVQWFTTLDYHHLDDNGLGIILSGDKVYITGSVTNVVVVGASNPLSGCLPDNITGNATGNVTGNCSSISLSHKDAFIAQYNPPLTDPVWLRTYSSPYVPTETSYFDEGRDILFHSDGYLYATGTVTRPYPVSGRKRTLWLAKVNPIDGNLLWQTYYERPRREGEGIDDVRWMEAAGNALASGDATGAFWVTGWESGQYFFPVGAWPNILLLHFNHAGTLLSSQHIDGSVDLDNDRGNDIEVLPSGSTILTGVIEHGGIWCGELDVDFPSCSNLYINYSGGWSDLVPEGEAAAATGQALAVDENNNIYVAGSIRRPGGIDTDFLISKYTTHGRAVD